MSQRVEHFAQENYPPPNYGGGGGVTLGVTLDRAIMNQSCLTFSLLIYVVLWTSKLITFFLTGCESIIVKYQHGVAFFNEAILQGLFRGFFNL